MSCVGSLAEELDGSGLVNDDGAAALGDGLVEHAGGLQALGLTDRDIEKVGETFQPIGEVARFFIVRPYPRRSQSFQELTDRQFAQACVVLDFHVLIFKNSWGARSRTSGRACLPSPHGRPHLATRPSTIRHKTMTPVLVY